MPDTVVIIRDDRVVAIDRDDRTVVVSAVRLGDSEPILTEDGLIWRTEDGEIIYTELGANAERIIVVD